MRGPCQTHHMKSETVSIDPEVMSGTPCFSGTRVPVQTLFDLLEGAETLGGFLDDFPGVSRETALKSLHDAQERHPATDGHQRIGNESGRAAIRLKEMTQ